MASELRRREDKALEFPLIHRILTTDCPISDLLGIEPPLLLDAEAEERFMANQKKITLAIVCYTYYI